MNDFEEHAQVVLGLNIICLIVSRVRTQHEFARSTTKVRNANGIASRVYMEKMFVK